MCNSHYFMLKDMTNVVRALFFLHVEQLWTDRNSLCVPVEAKQETQPINCLCKTPFPEVRGRRESTSWTAIRQMQHAFREAGDGV